ncbi:uncharacterized protein LOC115882034 [Sitophilus oryzae]|uniref:Uncharacterized protein LOC115882034 n=1 Tax=Sitophilus oryzae TaxID=7048 RepID=A0A6J2XW04_SITOR|nr:uncharacterized protein LOC115882034 [Sitophilus oryzae]
MLPSVILTVLTSLYPVILAVPLPELDHVDGVVLRTVPVGSTVVLKCLSNDYEHIFQFWHYLNKGIVIGPGNDYDLAKFRYEVLSGNLTIKGVTKHEEGSYECVSKSITSKEDMKIRVTQMTVQNNWDDLYEHDYNINVIRVLIALIAVILISMGAWFLYGVWRDRYRYPRYLEPDNDEDDDDESTEEIFSRPSTSKQVQHIIPIQKKKARETPFDDIDISTDFKSILDNTNDK